MVVLITMMGSVRERTDEIGIFRAIGFRKTHIMRIVLLEAAIISGLAGVFGYGLGYAATKAGLAIWGDSQSAMVHFNIQLAGNAILTALLVGLISSAYPAFMAARLDPNDALRAL
jgi:putative ABC transport system permease protein